VTAALVALAALLLVPSSGAVPSVGSPHAGVAPKRIVATVSAAVWPTPVRHVLVVLMENAEQTGVLANGSFERYLATEYATASNYFGICHPSAPNYLSITSGEAQQCGSDAYNVYNTTNLGDLLDAANRTWSSYSEGMPAPCDIHDSYPYAVRHNPFAYYQDIVGNTTRCDQHDLNFSAWNTTEASGAVPNFAFFAPNLLHDGHDTTVRYGDAWLRGWLSPMLNSSWFNDSVIFLTYDEGVNDSAGFNGTEGGHIYFTAISPYTRGVAPLAANETHYDLLTTIEWLLGLGTCGAKDNASAFPPMTGLFSFGTTPLRYDIAGTVEAAGAPVAGAVVNLTGQGSATLGPSGTFSFAVTNGTYDLAVAAAGFLPFSEPVTVNGTAVTLAINLTPVPATAYWVNGTVVNASTGAPIAGADVVVGTLTAFVTGASGAFQAELADGTYAIAVGAPGYRSVNGSVVVAGAAVALQIALDPLPSRGSGPPGPIPLVAVVSESPSPARLDQSTTFSSLVTGGQPPYSELWTFGDGTSAPGANVTHTYTSLGQFSVTLRARDSSGHVSARSFPINVTGALAPAPPAPTNPMPIYTIPLVLWGGIAAAIVAAYFGASLLLHRRRARALRRSRLGMARARPRPPERRPPARPGQ
jgi:PKD repeat protein